MLVYTLGLLENVSFPIKLASDTQHWLLTGLYFNNALYGLPTKQTNLWPSSLKEADKSYTHQRKTKLCFLCENIFSTELQRMRWTCNSTRSRVSYRVQVQLSPHALAIITSLLKMMVNSTCFANYQSTFTLLWLRWQPRTSATIDTINDALSWVAQWNILFVIVKYFLEFHSSFSVSWWCLRWAFRPFSTLLR